MRRRNLLFSENLQPLPPGTSRPTRLLKLKSVSLADAQDPRPASHRSPSRNEAKESWCPVTVSHYGGKCGRTTRYGLPRHLTCLELIPRPTPSPFASTRADSAASCPRGGQRAARARAPPASTNLARGCESGNSRPILQEDDKFRSRFSPGGGVREVGRGVTGARGPIYSCFGLRQTSIHNCDTVISGVRKVVCAESR